MQFHITDWFQVIQDSVQFSRQFTIFLQYGPKFADPKRAAKLKISVNCGIWQEQHVSEMSGRQLKAWPERAVLDSNSMLAIHNSYLLLLFFPAYLTTLSTVQFYMAWMVGLLLNNEIQTTLKEAALGNMRKYRVIWLGGTDKDHASAVG
jgi:hypothetical protein